MTPDKAVDEFLAGLEPLERVAFKKVRALFTPAGAAVEESMKHGMPSYAIGRIRIGAFNQQKGTLYVYTNADTIEPHRAALKALKLAYDKGCLRFTRPEQIPFGLLKKIIADAIAQAS